MANNEKKSDNTLVHDTIALTIITLVAGVLLGGVYTITKDPIEVQNEKTKAEAYEAVYEGADFVQDDEIDSELKKYNEELSDGNVQKSGETLNDVEISEVMKAQVDGADAGYVVTCLAKGYGGDVTLALGIDAEGAVKGIQIMDCTNETPGLGQNSSKADWNGQYEGMNADQEVAVVKDGSGSADSGTINAISGATITSRAVTRAVNGTLGFIKALSE